MRDLTAMVLSIGVVNIPTGKTQYDWSIYDTDEAGVFLTSCGKLMYCNDDTFQIGDKVTLRGNDTLRKCGNVTIVDYSPAVKEHVLEMLKKNNFDYYPIKAFRARAKNNRKLTTSFSVKGTMFTKDYK